MWVDRFPRETMVEVLDSYSHSPKLLATFEPSGLAVLLVQLAGGLYVPTLRSGRRRIVGTAGRGLVERRL